MTALSIRALGPRALAQHEWRLWGVGADGSIVWALGTWATEGEGERS